MRYMMMTGQPMPQAMLRAAFEQMCLPTRLGGFGFRHMAVAMLAAWPAAWAACLELGDVLLKHHGIVPGMALQPIVEALPFLRGRMAAHPALSRLGAPGLELILGPDGGTQETRQAHLDGAVFEWLHKAFSNPVEGAWSDLYGRQQAARLAALAAADGLSGSGWLITPPHNERTTLSPGVFYMGAAWRLGLPPGLAPAGRLPSAGRCNGTANCRAPLDLALFHLFTCHNAARSILHDGIVQMLGEALLEYGRLLQVDFERVGTVGPTGASPGARPGDVTVIAALLSFLTERFHGRQPTALLADLKVIAPICPTYVNAGSDRNPKGALQTGHDSKQRDFAAKLGPAGRAAVALPQDWVFHPWVCSIYGGMHDQFAADIAGLAETMAASAINRSATAGSDTADTSAAKIQNELRTRFSFTLQRLLFDFFARRMHECRQ